MEILTPQIIWKGYDAAALPLSVSVLSDKKAGQERVVLAYFNGPTTTEGVARVFVRCVIPAAAAGKKVPAVVIMADAHRSVEELDCSALVRRGYAVVMPDWVGARGDTPHFTIYPRAMAYANFTPDCLTSVPEDMRFNCWNAWAEVVMRALTFAAQLDGVDAGRLALIGDGVSVAAVIKAAAVDARAKCAVTLFSSGQRPAESGGQDYLRYKVALSDEAYAPMIKVPLLMMVASNEQDGSVDDMSDVFALIPKAAGARLSVSPRRSHAIGGKQQRNIEKWLASRLEGGEALPDTPALTASCSEHRLYYSVKAPRGCADVELFVAQAMREGALRNWHAAKLESVGEDEYISRVDVYDAKAPVYAFVNCSFEGGVSVSSPVVEKTPALLGVTDTPAPSTRLLYDSDMGTDDWVSLSPLAGANPLSMMQGPFGLTGVSSALGTMSTFKPGDACYRVGSELLQIMIYSPTEQDVTFTVTAEGGSGENARYAEYYHTERLYPADNWRKITLRPEDFKSPCAVCPDWTNIVNFRADSDAPVAIASMIWV